MGTTKAMNALTTGGRLTHRNTGSFEHISLEATQPATQPAQPAKVTDEDVLDVRDALRVPHITLTNESDPGVNYHPGPRSVIDGGPVGSWRLMSVWTGDLQNTPSNAYAGPITSNSDTTNFVPRDAAGRRSATARWIEVVEPGYYEVECQMLTSTALARRSVGVQIAQAYAGDGYAAIDGTEYAVGKGQIGASSYIRGYEGHTAASSICRNVFWVHANDYIGVVTAQMSADGDVSAPAGRSSLSIKKVPGNLVAGRVAFVGQTPTTWIARWRVWRGLARGHTLSDYRNGLAGAPLVEHTGPGTFHISGSRDYYVDFENLTAPPQLTVCKLGETAPHDPALIGSAVGTVLAGEASSGLYRFKTPYPMGVGAYVYTFIG